MYENGGKHKIKIDLPSFNFNFKNSKTIFNILSKLLIICIFFFLLIIGYSKINNMAKTHYNENSFNTNLTYMYTSSKAYFIKHNNLKNVGEASSYTLKEMIDNKIISKKKIKNIKSCDLEKSYVSITKTRDNLFIVVSSLTCDNVEEELEKSFSL